MLSLWLARLTSLLLLRWLLLLLLRIDDIGTIVVLTLRVVGHAATDGIIGLNAGATLGPLGSAACACLV